MREIKFRVMHALSGEWLYYNVLDFEGADNSGGLGWAINTIGLYTGLKDSYATEEYFGDIIEEEDGTRRVIEDACSVVFFRDSGFQYDIRYFWQLNPHKVIGNIYENEELLEVKQ